EKGPRFGSLLKMQIQVPQAPLDLSAYMPDGSFDQPFEVLPDEGTDAGPDACTAPAEEPAALALEAELAAQDEAATRPQASAGSDGAGVAAGCARRGCGRPALDWSRRALGDWPAAAGERATAARGREERTREALYEAIGRADDFWLAGREQPEEFHELLADSG